MKKVLLAAGIVCAAVAVARTSDRRITVSPTDLTYATYNIQDTVPGDTSKSPKPDTTKKQTILGN
jgi:hypothetical protein